MPIYAHTILMLCDAGLLFLCTTVMNDTAACHSPQVKRARSLGHTKSAYYRYKSLLARSGKHKRLLTHHFFAHAAPHFGRSLRCTWARKLCGFSSE
jgi:hypothetical protein